MLGLSKRHHRRTAAGRGRDAASPSEIPKQGWRDILLRVKDEQSKDNMSIVAAGVAFYFLLALFPALAAMVSIWGLVADPARLASEVQAMSGVLPEQARTIISDQLQQLAGAGGRLGFWAAVSILIALWSASQGTKALMTAFNIAYEEEEKRGFLRYYGTALLLTLGMILFVPVVLALIAAVPAIIGSLGLGETVEWVLRLARWPLLAVLVMAALAVLYRYAPSRDEPRWEWVSWGAGFATVVWLLGSIAFSVYVSNFGSFNETYGSFGAIIILLLWFNLTAFVVLLGAELNSEMEHQTARDTTVGSHQPMGSRGAHMADTVGPKP
ncbi:YihY/virulence factor BrkB family protein [Arenibaculum sp.]|jgi:membrane protein|uniref:YihY/virulence factor BrkB family protein n=1 Tax=Arenibaculum sp. TaxID=2865862 RepID=UPI002E0E34B1|nr:YihY/virulence factor BrkB family protein [Arenibaculum sp.]